MSKIGVQFDKKMVARAKEESKALVCIAVDARFLPPEVKWCSVSLKGPMSKERAAKVRELLFEFCGHEDRCEHKPIPVVEQQQGNQISGDCEEFLRTIRLEILKDTEGKLSMEWIEKWLVKTWNASRESVQAVAEPQEYEFLNSAFLEAMNDIGRYGHRKYGEESFQHRRLVGDNSRNGMERCQTLTIMDHAHNHFQMYVDGIKHDHFGTLIHQLAAVAFNAMMEAYFNGDLTGEKK